MVDDCIDCIIDLLVDLYYKALEGNNYYHSKMVVEDKVIEEKNFQENFDDFMDIEFVFFI